MCGIAGIFDFSDNDINPEIANRIGASLEHRGPDYSEVQFIKNNVVFIHTGGNPALFAYAPELVELNQCLF